MEIVFWIGAVLTLLLMLAYATIGALLLAAKYRMTHVPSRTTASSATPPIADLRYRTQ